MTTQPQDPDVPDDERADEQDAPVIPGGEDVRVGPEQSDEPQAGAAEPTD
ncbi:hypothetical protein Ade02nite_46870 [Paractinoplanes deccanensis]|uniref:Uncharacterized protein n=1 Tax=Paractinoplanes deccanensis TaxID=113561 RepID=A0ABQ3Y7R9_9ACTN|nr:hypothetical protein [Actinoplanes deccanensis]GID76046.1 hypothetical protein Ade02nite_46870 [Actinoplanes deccanensis]